MKTSTDSPASATPAQALTIVVIGGSGLIGRQTSAFFRAQGHHVNAASPSSGVNTVTREGLAGALAGADVVVDVSNSPSFEDQQVMEFFQKSTTHLTAAAAAAGVRHLVALSVVGTDRLQASGYFRAKLAQENLIKASGLPFTIVRATQFFEFLGPIAQVATRDEKIHLPSALMQPIYSGDVAAAVADAAVAAPLNSLAEVAGPEAWPMTELIRRYLRALNDPREVVEDESAGYFGTPVEARSLVPQGPARLAPTRLADWQAGPAVA